MIYESKNIDFTQLIIDNINCDGGLIDIDITEGHLEISIHTIDDRYWTGPEYDSCDGLSTLISGEIDFDLEIELYDEDGNDIDFDYFIDDDKIYNYLNDE